MEQKTKGQRTQEMIIEKALVLCGQHGFASTSMQMIAKECDLSQGAVMQHFPSKQRLLEALRRTVTASNHSYVDPRILATDDGFTALRKHMKYNLEWALKHRSHASILYLTYEAGIVDDTQKEIVAGAARLGTERMLRLILSAQRERQIAVNPKPELLAEIIQEFLLGLILRAVGSSEGTRVSPHLESKIDLFLTRIFSKKM